MCLLAFHWTAFTPILWNIVIACHYGKKGKQRDPQPCLEIVSTEVSWWSTALHKKMDAAADGDRSAWALDLQILWLSSCVFPPGRSSEEEPWTSLVRYLRLLWLVLALGVWLKCVWLFRSIINDEP